jgi:alpha-ketoglutarate-dependent taurine dioxygenase
MSRNVIEEIKNLSPARRDLLERILRNEAPRSARSVIVPRLRRSNQMPLSFAQQRLWFLDQLDPDNYAFNIPVALRVSGKLQIPVLEQCLGEIVRRHEVLRTTFTLVADQPMQVINPPEALSLPVEDLRGLSNQEREAELLRLSASEARRAFDLAHGPVLRVRVLRTGDEEHVILLTMHHIVSDAWSAGVLVEEVMALYAAYAEGRRSPLAELPIQYADFALWQREMLEGETLDSLLGYWKRQLHGVAQLNLPLDHPRPPVPSYRGARRPFLIPQALTNSLKNLSRQEGVTLFMTLLAAFQTLLYLYTKQTDIVVGTDIANRTREETEHLIGFFVNMLPLRTDMSGKPVFRELLKRVQKVTLAAYAHQDLPFEKLVAALNLERDPSRFPVFQAVFVLQNAPTPVLEISDLEVRPLPVNNFTVKFDLIMFLMEREGQLIGRLDYSTDLFEERTMDQFLRNFNTTLERVAAEPDVHINTLETSIAARQEALPDKEKEQHARKKLGVVKRKTVDLSAASLINTRELDCGSGTLLVAEPQIANVNLVGWATSNRGAIEEMLLRHGAVLWRGFDLHTTDDFEAVAGAMSEELFGEYGDLPRASVSGKVYGSTPYPADQPILFHNESSHMHRWPMKIWFFCAQAPAQGGETPIVDCRKIYQLLDPALRQRFANKKLMYIRNYTETLDVSWLNFFHTSDRAEVESYCRAAGIEFEWKQGDELRTRQVCQAIARHPRTGEEVFFNQLQLHHVSCLAPAAYESMRALFREEDYPRNVCYGDGTPLEDSVVSEICDLYRQTAVSFTWQEGDILMLDNMLTAHGRNPYRGARKIVVAMGEMMHQTDLSTEPATCGRAVTA